MDTMEVAWSNPEVVKEVVDNEIEQAKKLLLNAGYYVIDKTRVQTMYATSCVDNTLLESLDGESYQNFIRYYERRLFHEFVPLLEEAYSKAIGASFDRESCEWKHKVAINVILPK